MTRSEAIEVLRSKVLFLERKLADLVPGSKAAGYMVRERDACALAVADMESEEARLQEARLQMKTDREADERDARGAP